MSHDPNSVKENHIWRQVQCYVIWRKFLEMGHRWSLYSEHALAEARRELRLRHSRAINKIS